MQQQHYQNQDERRNETIIPPLFVIILLILPRRKFIKVGLGSRAELQGAALTWMGKPRAAWGRSAASSRSAGQSQSLCSPMVQDRERSPLPLDIPAPPALGQPARQWQPLQEQLVQPPQPA